MSFESPTLKESIFNYLNGHDALATKEIAKGLSIEESRASTVSKHLRQSDLLISQIIKRGTGEKAQTIYGLRVLNGVERVAHEIYPVECKFNNGGKVYLEFCNHCIFYQKGSCETPNRIRRSDF